MQQGFDFFGLLLFWTLFGLIFTIGLAYFAMRLDAAAGDNEEAHH